MGGIASGVGQMVAGGMQNVGSFIQNKNTRQSIDRNIAQTTLDEHYQQLNSTNSLVQGQALAARYRMQGTAAAQQSNEAFTASGVDAAVGTPAQVARTSTMFAELDAATAVNNARRQAWGFDVAAQQDELKKQALNEQYGQADLQMAMGIAGGESQMLQGFGSLVGGAMGMG